MPHRPYTPKPLHRPEPATKPVKPSHRVSESRLAAALRAAGIEPEPEPRQTVTPRCRHIITLDECWLEHRYEVGTGAVSGTVYHEKWHCVKCGMSYHGSKPWV